MAEAKPVYIVDDEPGVRRSVEFALSAAGYRVATWPSADAFLRDVNDLSSGCVLADVRMPGMDGLELREALKPRVNKMAVVLMTGHSDAELAARAKAAGVVAVLEKPFPRSLLLKAVGSAFDAIQHSRRG